MLFYGSHFSLRVRSGLTREWASEQGLVTALAAAWAPWPLRRVRLAMLVGSAWLCLLPSPLCGPAQQRAVASPQALRSVSNRV